MLRFLPFVGLLLLVAGCDSTALRADDVRRAFVYELELEDVPSLQPDGRNWDSGLTSPDPDVYLVLETRGGEIIAETLPLANVDPRDLPVFYEVPDAQIGINEEFYVLAYDDDGLLADEFIDEIGPLRLRNYLTDDLDPTFRVTSDSGDLEVTFRVRWDD